ncbi:hypothetical protein [Streptosporangium sp. NPDC048865]|uniref:hypothetical protein n=1 Tax=Streptosporangium sp. NPDC048865 TaxID=3155766 RepID=UPI003430C8F8
MPPRKRTAEKPAEAAPEQVPEVAPAPSEPVVETPVAPAAPLTPLSDPGPGDTVTDPAAPEQPPVEPGAPMESAAPPAGAAPLTPPTDPPPLAGPDPGDTIPDPAVQPSGDGLQTSAAPLTPPAAPLAPPPAPVVPEPSLREIASPGAEFIDLIDEVGQPIDPDAMFAEVSPNSTYVRTAQRIRRVYRETGASTRLGVQLLYPAGKKVDKVEAARLRGELVAVRAAQAEASAQAAAEE